MPLAVMQELAIWTRGARIRTLPAAIIPVLVGTAIAGDMQNLYWSRFGLVMAVSLCLQIGVNYANDYSDGTAGADDSDIRQGPTRLVGSGTKKPGAVLAAALVFFCISAGCGLALAAIAGWELLIAGALALLGAWTYTGGPFPYGYRALGELSVFMFFGLLAVAGSVYVQTEEVSSEAVLNGCGVGLMASALLIANNYRDIKSDKSVGKRTLAVILGAKNTSYFYILVLLGAAAIAIAQIPGEPLAALALSGIFIPVWGMFYLKPSFVPKLGNTVLGLCGYGAGLSIAFWL